MNPLKNIGFTIRKSKIEDAVQVLRVYNDANRIFPEKERLQGDIGLVHEVYEQNTVFVAEDSQEELIGWLAYQENETGCGVINGLYVLLDRQKMGIGKALLDSYIKSTQQRNVALIYLKALKNAPWSIQFYQKNGFIRGETIDGFFTHPGGLSVKVEPWEVLMLHTNMPLYTHTDERKHLPIAFCEAK